MQVLNNKLTEKQKALYDYIMEYQEKHGCAPILKEIQARFGWKSHWSARKQLNFMERKGWIKSGEKYKERRREGVVPEKAELIFKKRMEEIQEKKDLEILKEKEDKIRSREMAKFNNVGSPYLPDKEFERLKRRLFKRINRD